MLYPLCLSYIHQWSMIPKKLWKPQKTQETEVLTALPRRSRTFYAFCYFHQWFDIKGYHHCFDSIGKLNHHIIMKFPFTYIFLDLSGPI
jgi:hypothetical protein